MATYNAFIAEGARQGKSVGQMENAINQYREKFGEFDPEPIGRNYTAAHRIASQNVIKSLAPVDVDTLPPEGVEFVQNQEYYRLFDGVTYSDFEAGIRANEAYPDLSPLQILNENNKVLNYEPWTTLKKDRGVRFDEGARAGLATTTSALVQAVGGLTSIIDKGKELAYRLAKPEFYKQNKEMFTQQNDFKFNSIMKASDRTREVVEGDVPNYVRTTVPYKLASAAGEIPLIFTGAALPAVVTGRYYAEGLRESDGDHRIAAGYTALFGTLGYLVDRFTAGAASKSFRAMKTGTRGKLLVKQLGFTTVQAQKSAFGEF
jgi:hypothetical protein